jgi:hypothetical protein
MSMNRTSGSSGKASWIALHDQEALRSAAAKARSCHLTTAHQPNCLPQKAGPVSGNGLVIVASPQQRRPSGSPWKISLLSVRSSARMQVGGERFDSEEIHRLYDSDDYPLQRRTG